MAFLVTLFFGFFPMFFFATILYWLDRYEKEPIPLLIGVFAWGMIVAAGGAYIINTIFGITVFSLTGSEFTSDLFTGSISAPIIEESLKGMAVLLVFLFFRHEFDSVLDGIIYAGVAALGFAATENVLYIWRGYDSDGWTGLFSLVLIRVVLVGWQHPLYTSFTGIGLASARMSRSWFTRLAGPLIGLSMDMFTHSFHNTLASIPFLGSLTCWLGTFLDWSGVFFMLTVIIWAAAIEEKNIARLLREEVSLGIMTQSQYRTACSDISQTFARLNGLFSGHSRDTNRFYQVCGELAHKKKQLEKLGDENGNAQLIQQYRLELSRLSKTALTS
ncbi:MAG: PrsW family intramembrane metalloprotease [Chloroflexota bacterium]